MTPNAANEANMRRMQIARVSIDRLKAAAEIHVGKLKSPARLVRSEHNAFWTKIARVSRTRWLLSSADRTLLRGLGLVTAGLEESHGAVNASKPRIGRVRMRASWRDTEKLRFSGSVIGLESPPVGAHSTAG